MALPASELVLWYLALCLEILICALAYRCRLYRQLPIFTSYITAVLAEGLFMYWIYHHLGYSSRPAFFSFWISQALLLAWRGASIGELVWTASRPYPGFRVVVKSLLTAIALILFLHASWFAMKTSSCLPPFVLTLEGDLELTAAVILVLLLSLSSYYEVILNRIQKLVALGLFVYSLAQVVNNTVSNEWLQSYFRWWGVIRITSFHAALVIWLVALARPKPPQPEAELPPDLQTIREIMRHGTELMHELAANLAQFRRKLQK
jgi:hypothetical protein